MEIKAMELTVHSCKDLQAGFNFFQKMSVYANVWIGNPKKGQRTPPDRENDRNPEWKHQMRFELDEPADKLALDFEIRKEGGLGDRSIGRVHVPVADLLEGYEGGVRYVCYQVKGSNDRAAGLLNFSYSLEGKDCGSFHGTNPQEDAGNVSQIGSEWCQAPSAPTVVPESLSAAAPSILYPPTESYYPPPSSSFGSYQPETGCMEAHHAPIRPPSAPYLPIPAEAEGHHHPPPSLHVWPPHPSRLIDPINPEFPAAQPPLVFPHFPPPFPPPPHPPALPFPPQAHLYHHYPPPDHPFRPHGPLYWH
ncbi:unnamed protein product [Victoria cruziana]